jgi:hypothetical protein
MRPFMSNRSGLDTSPREMLPLLYMSILHYLVLANNVIYVNLFNYEGPWSPHYNHRVDIDDRIHSMLRLTSQQLLSQGSII